MLVKYHTKARANGQGWRTPALRPSLSNRGYGWTTWSPLPRRRNAQWLSAAHPQRQALEEITQQLVPAQAEILVLGLAEQRRQFRLGQWETGERGRNSNRNFDIIFFK